MKNTRNTISQLVFARQAFKEMLESQAYKSLIDPLNTANAVENLIMDTLSFKISPEDAREMLLIGTKCSDFSLLNPLSITWDDDGKTDIIYTVSAGGFTISVQFIRNTEKIKFKASSNLAKAELKKYLIGKGLGFIK